MILLRLGADQARVPQLRPATILFLACVGVHLPQFTHPEAASPEEAFTLFPFSRLAISVSEKSKAPIGGHVARFGFSDDRFPFGCRPIYFLLQQLDGLRVCSGC